MFNFYCTGGKRRAEYTEPSPNKRKLLELHEQYKNSKWNFYIFILYVVKGSVLVTVKVFINYEAALD